MGKKGSLLVKIPMHLYVSLHDRQLTNHISFLVSYLLEEFLNASDVRISWAEMPSKSEQREYLKRKLEEFCSRTGIPTEPPKPSFQEKAEPTYAEPPKSPVQERMETAYMQDPRPPVQERAEPPRTSIQERMENYAEPLKPSVQEQQQDGFSFAKEDRWWESLW
jgi:hypothetical protein